MGISIFAKMKSAYNNHYTHKDYSRGATRRRDFVYEAVISPLCVICGIRMQRKKYKSGLVELMSKFVNRKTCSIECLTTWRKIPENNGRFQGLMYKKCPKCGGGFKIYGQGTNSHAKQCFKCYQSNRPIAYNRQETKKVLCLTCGESTTNRLPSGRLKKHNNFYCSRECFFKRKK